MFLQFFVYQKNNCDKTQKLKFWLNKKNQIVTKLKTQIVTKFKVFICDNNKNLICDKTQKLNFLQNAKTSIVTKLKNSYCDKTQ